MGKELIIDVSGLSKSFAGKVAVNNISLQVAKGEIFGFLGPNGAGKTTSIRMLCGLLTPDAAQGSCLGFDVLTQSYEIKKQVGYMTQSFSLYKDLSVYENLDFVARLYEIDNRRERVLQSIEELGLAHRQKQLAGELSGGWKQRLALSAALIHDPKLLLLDEPTAGVDPKARREFWAHIQKLSQKGITTLVSTHYMDEAERCSELAYIFNGQIVAKGSADEIIAGSGLFTWVVTGSGDLADLAERLQAEVGIEQVARFGGRLHVSSKDKEALLRGVKKYQAAPWSWQEIVPDLEDVFISLCSSDKDFEEQP